MVSARPIAGPALSLSYYSNIIGIKLNLQVVFIVLILTYYKGVSGDLTTKPPNYVVVRGSSTYLNCYSNSSGSDVNWRYWNSVIVDNCTVESAYTRFYSTWRATRDSNPFCRLRIRNNWIIRVLRRRCIWRRISVQLRNNSIP